MRPDPFARRLVVLADLYAKHTGLSVATVSRHATGSGDTIGRLKRGGAITTHRLYRAIRYFRENWPESLPWEQIDI